MKMKKKRPDPEEEREFLPGKLLGRKSHPKVSGRVSVDVRKTQARG